VLSDPQLLALAVAGLLVGATGTWSPCGFSMIETIGPTGHTGGLRTTLAAAATFAPFAVVGGALTFGLLALAGDAAFGAAGGAAYAVAAAVSLAAAIAEARGTPIVPQVRRQLPVGWRSSAPMPLAAAGYGVLLGLGFTTFVLSYGVWALMGISLALGDPVGGLVIGIAFGVGRALPIVVLAPLADRRSGERACEAMAMRPGLLRGARVGDAVALLAVAALLVGGAGAASASRKVATRASDPSVSGSVLAYENDGGRAVIEQDGKRRRLPGSDPAIGGPYAAVIEGGRVSVIDRGTEKRVGGVAAAGADGLAVNGDWLAVRRRNGGHDAIEAFRLGKSGKPGRGFRVARVAAPSQLSRPAIGGHTIVYALAKQGANSLIRARLRTGDATGSRKIASSRTLAFTGPSILGPKVAYVATSRKHQSIRVKGLGKGLGRTVYKRGAGPPTLWTTALGADRVTFTLLAKGGVGKLLSVGR
jgi:hypothetical protein